MEVNEMTTRKMRTKDYDLDLMTGKNIEESSAEVKTNGPQTRNGIVVNTGCLNVRRSPRGGNNIVGFLERGDKVQIVGENGPYYKISTSENSNVFASKKYIREE